MYDVSCVMSLSSVSSDVETFLGEVLAEFGGFLAPKAQNLRL